MDLHRPHFQNGREIVNCCTMYKEQQLAMDRTNMDSLFIANMCHEHGLQIRDAIQFTTNDIIQSEPKHDVKLIEKGQEIHRPQRATNVEGDGNCLFRAASVALTGSERNHYLLRLLSVALAMKSGNWGQVQSRTDKNGMNSEVTAATFGFGVNVKDNKFTQQQGKFTSASIVFPPRPRRTLFGTPLYSQKLLDLNQCKRAHAQRIKPKQNGQDKMEIEHETNVGGSKKNGPQKMAAQSKQRNKSLKKIKRERDVDNYSDSTEDDSEKVAAAELKWLLDPIGVELFLKVFFEKQVWFINRSNDRGHYQNLFGQQQMMDIIEQNYVEWGVNVNAAKYVNDRTLTPNGTGKVFNHILREKYQDGCSIQLTNPQAFSDTVWECCDRLQELFCCFVGANSYLTPAKTQGFAPHWDDVDAFIIQLEGSKYWRVYEPSTEETTLPGESSANFRQCDLEENKLCWEGWLKPGDLLYMPRGFIHQGYTNETEHSLHLTISFSRKNTCADLMEKLLPQVLSAVVDGSVQARHALPEGYMSYMGVGVNAQHKQDAAQLFADTNNDVMDDVQGGMMTMFDAGANMMAAQFMQQALPPKLTDEEKSMSVFGEVEGLISDTRTEGAKKPLTLNTQIKLLRKHAQRLVFEAEHKAHLLHRMHNSRVFEQSPAATVDLLDYMIKPVQQLIAMYPKSMSIKQFCAGSNDQKLHLAQTLWDAGLIRKCLIRQVLLSLDI